MARKQEHKTHVNSRVRIKDSVTHMYRSARAYGEGTVKATRHDDLGYPLIFVEWDKDHWAYSGEADGWTLEAHFDLVGEEKMDEKDLAKALADLVKKFGLDGVKEDKVEEKKGMTYDQVLNRAIDDALDGEAFIVLVAKPESYDESGLIVPHIYVHSKSDDAAMFLNAVMADVAAQSYATLVFKMMEKAKRDSDS